MPIHFAGDWPVRLEQLGIEQALAAVIPDGEIWTIRHMQTGDQVLMRRDAATTVGDLHYTVTHVRTDWAMAGSSVASLAKSIALFHAHEVALLAMMRR